jgi:hypothetical protein
MLAVGEPGIGGGLVADRQPFEMNDADKFAAAFPDLALLKFHELKTSLLIFISREMIGRAGIIFSWPGPACWPPLPFSSRRCCRSWIVSGRISFGSLSGIYRP